MANWMLLTGAGAYIGRFFGRMRGKIPFLLFLQFLFSLLPILMLLKLDLWKAISLPSGSVPGLIPVIRSMFLFQLPFCLLNGFLFIAYVHELSEMIGKRATSGSYAIESAGGMFAGLLVNIYFLNFSGMFDGLRILLVINLLVCILFSITCGIRLQKIIMVPVCLIFMVLPFFADLDTYTGKLYYPGQHLIFHKNTFYGKLDVTMNAGQLNYFENGLLLFSSNNEIVNEESVHFAMIQHPCPKKILLVSGGISGTVTEILKYHTIRIDYVELDPGLIKLGRRYSKILDDKRIHIIQGDARRFIRQTKEKYDVVLVNLPEPSTLLINRFYSREFFMELKQVLTPGAVVCESLPTTSDYVSKSAAQTNSTLVQTMKTRFRNVLILPGQKNYFLASDSTLSP
jgi:spermidine synthase